MVTRQAQNNFFLAILLAGLLFLGLIILIKPTPTFSPKPTVCTQEAKLCPDGSYVGRVGPRCEFAACPIDTSSWQTKTDAKTGITFSYPKTLTTSYIRTQDWPPQVSIQNGAYNCTTAGSEIASAGKTEKRLVDNREYCVTTETGGAAGTSYSQYAYVRQISGKVVIMTFTIAYPECGNYPEPQQTECQNERTAFDLDSLVDRMFNTLKFD